MIQFCLSKPSLETIALLYPRERQTLKRWDTYEIVKQSMALGVRYILFENQMVMVEDKPCPFQYQMMHALLHIHRGQNEQMTIYPIQIYPPPLNGNGESVDDYGRQLEAFRVFQQVLAAESKCLLNTFKPYAVYESD